MPEPTPTPPAPTPPAPNAMANGGKPAGTLFERIPDKYRVSKDDKTPDLEASTDKLIAGYGELNAKMIAQGLPPEKPEDYKIEGEISEGINFEELKKKPEVAAALKRFHAKGMSNAQVKEVLTFFTEDAIAENDLDVETCEKALRTDFWKTEDEYKKQSKSAFRAANGLVNKLNVGITDPKLKVTTEQVFRKYGNDPLMNRLFAMLGADMAEDADIGGDAQGGEIASSIATIDARVNAIMDELSKLKSHDPKRKELMAEKSRLFQRRTELSKQKAA